MKKLNLLSLLIAALLLASPTAYADTDVAAAAQGMGKKAENMAKRDAKKAEREAKKAQKKAEREKKKAEKKAQREAKKAEKAAADAAAAAVS